MHYQFQFTPQVNIKLGFSPPSSLMYWVFSSTQYWIFRQYQPHIFFPSKMCFFLCLAVLFGLGLRLGLFVSCFIWFIHWGAIVGLNCVPFQTFCQFCIFSQKRICVFTGTRLIPLYDKFWDQCLISGCVHGVCIH